MVSVLARSWWVFVLRGLGALLFGVLAVLAPRVGLLALVTLFGAYAFVDGVFRILAAVRAAGWEGRWGSLFLSGILGVATGVVAAAWPGLTALALLYLVGGWAIVTGALEIVASIRLRKEITGEWLLALAGVASIALGVLLFLFPGPGALATVTWLGLWALVAGFLLISLGLRLRAWERGSLSA